jgi:hypothetical protein
MLLVSVGLLVKTLGYLDSRDVPVIRLWVGFAATLGLLLHVCCGWALHRSCAGSRAGGQARGTPH